MPDVVEFCCRGRELSAAREAQHAIKVQRVAAAAAEEREASCRVAAENERQLAALQARVRCLAGYTHA